MIHIDMSNRYGVKDFVVQRTSCSCGGSHAILGRRSSGAYEMIGCICHTTVEQVLQWSPIQ